MFIIETGVYLSSYTIFMISYAVITIIFSLLSVPE